MSKNSLKWAENGQKRPKMVVHKRALFEKNIISDLGQNGPNDAHRPTKDVI